MTDVSRLMLKDQIDHAIDNIENESTNATCPAHAPLAAGIVLLLQKAKLELEEPPQAPSPPPPDQQQTLTIAGIKISGGASVLSLIGVAYVVLKIHGVIP